MRAHQLSAESSPEDGSKDVKIIARVCPLCDDPNEKTPNNPYSHPVWTMKACRTCSLVYLDRAPDTSELFESMAWERTSRVEAGRRAVSRPIGYRLSRMTRWRLHLFPRRNMPDLLAHHAEPGPVLDLGCGDGAPMAGLDERFTPFGIEVSTQAATAANRRFAERGGKVVNDGCLGGLAEFPDRHFSAATLRSYLEHEIDPKAVLTELNRVLRPGGIAIVKVPNYACINRRVTGRKWPGFRFPEHVNHFTPSTLGRMAEKCGYRIWFGPMWKTPVSDNMWAILRKA